MKLLLAEDDLITAKLISAALVKWGYEVVHTENGTDAWNLLNQPDAPFLILLDWSMPGLDGIEVCRLLRHQNKQQYRYILMLTSKTVTTDVLAAIEAGVDDYLRKPVDYDLLKARLDKAKQVLAAKKTS